MYILLLRNLYIYIYIYILVCVCWGGANLHPVRLSPIKDRSIGLQEIVAPRFQDSRHMKVIKLSIPHTGHLYSQEIFLVLSSVGG